MELLPHAPEKIKEFNPENKNHNDSLCDFDYRGFTLSSLPGP
jgi:hypothetical protein